MKILTIMALLVSISAQADIGKKIGDALFYTSAPTSAYGMTGLISTSGCIRESDDPTCVFKVSQASTIITSFSTVAHLKEDLKQVEADAYNYLAGEEMTLALEHQMNVVREMIPETRNLDDEKVAALIIEISNL